MVFRKPGNSRDDKPSGPSGRNTRGGDKGRNSSSSSRSSAPKFNNNSNDQRPGRGPKTSEGTGERSYTPRNTDRPFGDRPSRGTSSDRPYNSKSSQGSFDKPFGDRPKRSSSDRPYSGRPERGGSDKPFGDRPKRSSSDRPYSGRPERGGSDKPSFGDRPQRKSFGDKPFGDRPARKSFDKPAFGEKSFTKRPSGDRPDFRDKDNRGYSKSYEKRGESRSAEFGGDTEKPVRTMRSKKQSAAPASKDDGLMRLNRYISNAGICSRRKADELIMAGVVSVNGEVISELGHKVDPAKDVIRYNGETLKREKMVYVLLNKPKDYITTTEDPHERRTVMHLVEKASKERIYPVGRLDRNTTGLLLMTNDGDLADKLSHPKNNISKLYLVELDKSLTQGDLNKLGFGVELEDGFIKPDAVSYVAGGTKREVGIQIHSGRNRIVRRIFEHLGYEVVKLDRSVYANLTKKDLPRGRWRFLDEKEVIQLKHLV
ncbi:pseudouridine synthase [Mucilaginibacter agri]|uniref:Pseudouridine synthase n=1 Tax=Mucilaginibacter agri TaxID=2695265 RepID=A0A966DSX0_9SPHI|nr:pseudouridine synthase [Mucilaginibacter agri]NCD68786.1 pseudouridine synthase [Mucilaginibacter agri]